MPGQSLIVPSLLRAVGAPAAAAETYAPLLAAACIVEGDPVISITSLNGVCMLVAQLAHESGGFTQMSESLNYQVVALLNNRRFSATQARAFGRDDSKGQRANQPAIANLMYGGRMGNRLGTDDGWNFRGGGLLQITGRNNYAAWGSTIGLSPEKAAEYVRVPGGSVSAALWFWRTNGLIGPAWQGDVATCTRIINGGQNGLADRLARFQAAKVAARLAS